MTAVNDRSVMVALQLAGFSPCSTNPRLFLVDGNLSITPAFLCLTIKRSRKIRLSGGVGLYFREFERIWDDSISKTEKRFNFTLPMIMAIDNYMTLIDNGVFSFTDDSEEIADYARQIYNLCAKFPCSAEEFGQVLIARKMIDKNVSDYFHIFGYHEDDNIFFRKSVGFIYWFLDRWPEFSQDMFRCLTEYQSRRLKSMERDA